MGGGGRGWGVGGSLKERMSSWELAGAKLTTQMEEVPDLPRRRQDVPQQFLGVEILEDVGGGAGALGGCLFPIGRVRRQHDHFRRVRRGGDLPHQFQPKTVAALYLDQ